jgi:hypothetical protein
MNLEWLKILEEQCKILQEWIKQQYLPEEQRDQLQGHPVTDRAGKAWEDITSPSWDFDYTEYRLVKKPKKPKIHKATVYWYRDRYGKVFSSLGKMPEGHSTLIGIDNVTLTEK